MKRKIKHETGSVKLKDLRIDRKSGGQTAIKVTNGLNIDIYLIDSVSDMVLRDYKDFFIHNKKEVSPQLVDSIELSKFKEITITERVSTYGPSGEEQLDSLGMPLETFSERKISGSSYDALFVDYFQFFKDLKEQREIQKEFEDMKEESKEGKENKG